MHNFVKLLNMNFFFSYITPNWIVLSTLSVFNLFILIIFSVLSWKPERKI